MKRADTKRIGIVIAGALTGFAVLIIALNVLGHLDRLWAEPKAGFGFFYVVFAAVLTSLPCYYGIQLASLPVLSAQLLFVTGVFNGLVFVPVGVLIARHVAKLINIAEPFGLAGAVVICPLVGAYIVAIVWRGARGPNAS